MNENTRQSSGRIDEWMKGRTVLSNWCVVLYVFSSWCFMFPLSTTLLDTVIHKNTNNRAGQNGRVYHAMAGACPSDPTTVAIPWRLLLYSIYRRQALCHNRAGSCDFVNPAASLGYAILAAGQQHPHERWEWQLVAVLHPCASFPTAVEDRKWQENMEEESDPL